MIFSVALLQTVQLYSIGAVFLGFAISATDLTKMAPIHKALPRFCPACLAGTVAENTMYQDTAMRNSNPIRAQYDNFLSIAIMSWA